MEGTGVVDRFLAVFSRYIDGGFGLLAGEVAFLATALIVIDVTLAALFWTWSEQDDVLARLVQKTLFVGIFAYVIGNWPALADIVFDSFAGLGLKASASGLSASDLMRPGHVAQVGIDAARPLLDAIAELVGFVSFFENFLQIVILLLAWLVVITAFFVLAIQLFVTLIEFKLTTLAGFVLVPFGLFGKTAFLAERVLGNVVSSGIKVLVLAVIVGIGSTLFSEFTEAMPPEPTLEDALAIVLASLTMLALGIFGPGVANGIVAGGPQLGAGAAAGTALVAGGGAAGGIAATKLAGGAIAAGVAGTARSAARASGAATMGYAAGSAGRSGPAAVAGGAAGAARTASGALTSPLRKAAADLRQEFGKGARAALGRDKGRDSGALAAEATKLSRQEPPAWARAMRQRQAIGQSTAMAAHAVRSGDGQGAGAVIDTREKE
jgi:type IV secretion system protein TrbL